MRIRALTLLAADLRSLFEFYAGELAWPLVRRNPDALTLQVGATELTFRRGGPAAYHFALNVHPARFERARAALAAITPLLQGEDGAEVFDFRSWDARACYFYDPAGNVAEIIARRELANRPLPPEPGLLSIGEIGLVTEDVPALTARLAREPGLPVYRESAGETFAALGDAEGLLILAQRGRIWHPDTGKAAAGAPMEAALDVAGTAWRLDGPPYRFTRAAG